MLRISKLCQQFVQQDFLQSRLKGGGGVGIHECKAYIGGFLHVEYLLSLQFMIAGPEKY